MPPTSRCSPAPRHGCASIIPAQARDQGYGSGRTRPVGRRYGAASGAVDGAGAVVVGAVDVVGAPSSSRGAVRVLGGAAGAVRSSGASGAASGRLSEAGVEVVSPGAVVVVSFSPSDAELL